MTCSFIQLTDLEGDGWPDDVLVTTNLGWTYALNESGDLLWKVPKASSDPPVFADFDHDGYANEFALTSRPDYTVYAFDNDGTGLWNFSIHYGYALLAVGDLDHNGFEDNLILSRQYEILALDKDGAVLWNYTLPTLTGDILLLTVADVDGNGYRDNVLSATRHSSFHTSYVFNNAGALIGKGGVGGGIGYYFGDFDGDGYADDHITARFGLKMYRFGTPQADFAFFPNTSRSYEEGPQGFSYTVTNREAFPLDLCFNLSAPDTFYDSEEEYPVGNSSGYLALTLTAGTYNLTLTCSYAGVPFRQVQLAVTVSGGIGVSVLFWCLGTVTLVAVWYNKYKRMETARQH